MGKEEGLFIFHYSHQGAGHDTEFPVIHDQSSTTIEGIQGVGADWGKDSKADKSVTDSEIVCNYAGQSPVFKINSEGNLSFFGPDKLGIHAVTFYENFRKKVEELAKAKVAREKEEALKNLEY